MNPWLVLCFFLIPINYTGFGYSLATDRAFNATIYAVGGGLLFVVAGYRILKSGGFR